MLKKQFDGQFQIEGVKKHGVQKRGGGGVLGENKLHLPKCFLNIPFNLGTQLTYFMTSKKCLKFSFLILKIQIKNFSSILKVKEIKVVQNFKKI